jgi:hypothetical protein
MMIIKGQTKFSMVDITPKELHTIFDAFNSGRHYFTELQKATDKELSKATGTPLKEIPKIREVLKEKSEFYLKHSQKIQSYAKK